MEFAKKYQSELIHGYVKEGKSTYQLAEELGTNSSKVLKALTFLGVPRRTRSEAQKTALAQDRTSHPTKGKKMSAATKAKMGESRAKIWSEMSQEERDKVAQTSKENWDKMPEAKKEQMRQMAADAVRVASKEGSKMERYLRDYLRKTKRVVDFHLKGLIPAEKLEVDLFLPTIQTAIEIDGPSHFLPIWGEAKLSKHQKADALKSGLLLNAGFRILRVKQIDKTLSKTKMKNIAQVIESIIAQIEDGTITSKLIEIEVKDGKLETLFK